jgi:hypothetical protein
MPKFCTFTVYFERECITCININIHNNLWQFLFNLIGKINRDGYSSLIIKTQLRRKVSILNVGIHNEIVLSD